MSNILKIRLFLFSLLAITVLFLLYKAVVPFGEISYSWQKCNSSNFITQLKPKDRVQGECFNILKGEPVYFNLNTPRSFDEAEVKVSYKIKQDKSGSAALKVAEPLSFNIIELGIQADEQKHYKLMPLENRIIDTLDWQVLEKDRVYLFQRNNDFKSVDEFLKSLPAREEILTYHYDLPVEKYLPKNKETQILISSQKPANNIKPLRGPYQFYTYSAFDSINFDFSFSDLNLNKDDDNIKVIVYYNSEPILQKEIKDERGGEESRKKKVIENLNLNLKNLEKGFYKIVLQTTDDIITEKINTSQQIISFINKIRLADAIDENLITLFTDVSQIGIGTMNPSGLQKVLVNKEILNIDETYKTFHQQTSESVSKLQFAKDDLIISGSGVFSFSESSLYNPDYKKMSSNSSLENINYIVTSYSPNQERIIKFDLANMYREKGAYSFILSISGLLHNDEVDDWIEVEGIEVNLRGRSLWEKLNF